jgi:prolyl oligopeptidase
MNIRRASIFILALAVLGACRTVEPTQGYSMTSQSDFSYELHGTRIRDPYQWLEDGKDPKVVAWEEAQAKQARACLDGLPQRKWLVKRFGKLWRYDDESVPQPVLQGDRLFYWTKKKADEHWVFCTREREGAKGVELLNPNTWGPHDTLDVTEPSRGGKYVAFGKAKRGDENPIIRVMETATKNILPDTLKGWKQGGIDWLPDNSGFFYTAQPLKGEVPQGEEYYWMSVYFHRLGSPAEKDEKVFSHDKVREYWHAAGVSEDGKYILFYRGMYYKTEIYIQPIDRKTPPVPIVSGMDAQYSAEEINARLYITSDKDAPMSRVWVTDVGDPERSHWKELIPESADNLEYISFVAGHLYGVYAHNATSRIKIYDLEGKYLRDLPLPTLGTASVSGYFSKKDVWVGFSSFTYPSTVFKYLFDRNELKLYHRPPIHVDVSDYAVEQVWYPSKDGTKVSMFLIRRKDLQKNGNVPVLLTGYGGFNVPMKPYFSTSFVVWLEAGGMAALPNLRGGGEYGKAWHEAGMKERKQNVFDDFIAAAEWLIANQYTTPARLAIGGGSNGGLLVGAALVQRPDLFRVVDCGVPLLDMVRYHKFGMANEWAEEYGNSDDPEAFKYLHAYSPYHHVKDGTAYPAVLLTASEDDARVDPMHARKMAARLQQADPKGRPILLIVQRASGHGGGTKISTLIQQRADTWSFLMNELGMQRP